MTTSTAQSSLPALSRRSAVPGSCLGDASIEQRRDLARWYRDLYPGPEWLSPLQPDALAEELVAQVLQDCPELSRSGFRGLPADQALRVLTVLDRAALMRPPLEPALMEVLASDLEGLAPSAMAVALQTGDPSAGCWRRSSAVIPRCPPRCSSLWSRCPSRQSRCERWPCG